MKFNFFQRRFKFYFQLDSMDCGPACLKMLAEHYGKLYSLEYLRNNSYLSREGVSLLSVNDAAERIGLRTLMLKLSYEKLATAPLPCILHWNQGHFVVLVDIKRKKSFFNFSKQAEGKDVITLADPSKGIFKLDKETFLKGWISTHDRKGIALLTEPTPSFYEQEDVKEPSRGFKPLLRYLIPYRRQIIQLIIGMSAASLIALVFPFLTQVLVDYGVVGRNIQVIYMILAAQLFLFLGEITIDILRSWILLHVNSRISLNIISDFLSKLLRLPIKYFDSKAIGDLVQRITDHKRIETFLTTVTLDSMFSIISILLFTIVLGIYSPLLLLLFVVFNSLAIGWILLYQKRRKLLDYKRFQRNTENQQKIYELIEGMQEIKLYGSETTRRWEWERLQVNFFKLNIKSLTLEQYQKFGFVFFSQLKNILITYVAARETINGSLTLGAMLSISYIIGQTNSPLLQLVNFLKASQDARLSMMRLQEIHDKKNEELEGNERITNAYVDNYNTELGDIVLNNVSFQYEGPNSPHVLKNINLTIKKGQVTAIVGASGSGKTTLMKLLLNFYKPVEGTVKIGNVDLQAISPRWWRQKCGSVMQEGYIFSDSILKNIAADGHDINAERFKRAVGISNLEEFVNDLPLLYSTIIGSSGIGLSGGQKQRILISRAVYKDPQYLFFDEATSNLDANNEKTIMNNLDNFFTNKTVVVIAHRLSTVKNADKIIVLDKGSIVETGNHELLTSDRGYYYKLVKNQLELGN